MWKGKLFLGTLIAALVMSVTLLAVRGQTGTGAGDVAAPAGPALRDGDGAAGRRDRAALEALSGLLEREVEERLRLQQQVDRLAARLEVLESPGEAETEAPSAPAAPPPAAADTDAPTGLSEAALLAAGFSSTEAAYYRRRFDEAAMSRLYLRDQAEREGWLGTPRYFTALEDISDGVEALRAEMDDEAYSRYLYALGRPNQVSVQRVLAGSAAEAAGLQTGDVILSYQGERMFGVSDVRQAIRGGDPGETVAVEILRDGRRIQAYVPRGPLGVSMSSERVLPAGDS